MTTIGKGQSSDNHIYWVAENVIANDFPPVSSALRDPDGLLAIGGDLGPERLIDAYQKGIFPWYSEGQPILWWSPNPRCVLEPGDINISRSLCKTNRKGHFNITFNKAFKQVILACSKPRQENEGTWITQDMHKAYVELHKLGHAVSVECWCNKELVGGLYGITIGKVFFGESMFSYQTDASKVALVYLVNYLNSKNFRLIDCQVHSTHLQNLGAIPMPRDMFINLLDHYCHQSVTHDWLIPEMQI